MNLISLRQYAKDFGMRIIDKLWGIEYGNPEISEHNKQVVIWNPKLRFGLYVDERSKAKTMVS